MVKKLVIYGAAFANIIKLIDAINSQKPTWEIVGFIDDELFGRESVINDYPILGDKSKLSEYCDEDVYFVNNVGSSTKARFEVTEILENQGVQFASLLHPSVDASYVEIGKGVVVLDGAKLGVNVRVGDHSLIRWGSLITHDNLIGDHVFIGPGVTVCGYTKIDRGVYVGAGATVIERVSLGEWSTVGAGSVVIHDVHDREQVAGVPAAKIASANYEG